MSEVAPAFLAEIAGGVVMRNEMDEIADTLFAVAIVAAIGFGAANLAVQVNKERTLSTPPSQARGLANWPIRRCRQVPGSRAAMRPHRPD